MSLKKPLSAGLVIGLLALASTALPAMASAAPSLKAEGVNVAVGSKVVATSTNLVTVTSAGNLTCKEVRLVGTVKTNPGAELNPGTGTAKECLANGAAPVEITSISFTDKFNAGLTDLGTAKFVYNIPAAGLSACHLETSALKTTWINGSNKVKVTSSALTGGGGSAGCPTSGTITGELTLKTEAGVNVTVNE